MADEMTEDQILTGLTTLLTDYFDADGQVTKTYKWLEECSSPAALKVPNDFKSEFSQGGSGSVNTLKLFCGSPTGKTEGDDNAACDWKEQPVTAFKCGDYTATSKKENDNEPSSPLRDYEATVSLTGPVKVGTQENQLTVKFVWMRGKDGLPGSEKSKAEREKSEFLRKLNASKQDTNGYTTRKCSTAGATFSIDGASATVTGVSSSVAALTFDVCVLDIVRTALSMISQVKVCSGSVYEMKFDSVHSDARGNVNDVLMTHGITFLNTLRTLANKINA